MQKTFSTFRTVISLVSLLAVNPLLAATVTWSGAVNDIWSNSGNWSGGSPGPGNDIVFGDTDASAIPGPFGTPNNSVDSSIAIQSLKYSTIIGSHSTQIPLGSTLTVNGIVSTNVLVGTATDLGNTAVVYATMLGQGGLLVTNTNGAILVIQGSQTSGLIKRATLDMEGLDTFTAYVRQIRVGAESGGSSTPWYNRGAGTLTLAKTNHIFLASPVGTPGLFVAEGSGNSAVNIVNLGQTNAFFSDAGITVGGRKSDSGTLMSFNPAFTSPSALFRNLAGTGRQALWAIGDNIRQSGTSSGKSTGAIDFSNGTVDAQVSTIIVGRGPAGAGDTGTGTGTLTFGAGTIDTDALDIGVSANANITAGIGTLNVNGSGLLVVNTLMRLAVGSVSSGTLNINGGTVRANAITNAGGTITANIAMAGGTLVLTNAAGNVSAPILNFTMLDSTLTLPVTSGGTNIVATALSTSGTTTYNTINVLSLPAITGYPAQFPLISYGYFITSGGTDFQLGSLPAGSPPFTGYISNNFTTSTIDLVITGGPAPTQVLFWNGNVPGGNWDTTTANWRNASLVAAIYRQGDFVTFNDSASGTTTAALTTTLTPALLSISNVTKPYTFNGSGSIGGAVTLIKDGASTLTIANSGINTFSNGVSILGGKLQLSGSADRLPTGSTVTLADVAGAALDLNNVNQTIHHLEGGGSSGGNVTLGSGKLTVDGSGTYGGVISGTGMLIKTNPVATGTGGGTLVLSGASTYSGGTIIGGYTNTPVLAVANQTGSGTGTGFVRVLTNGTFVFGGSTGPGGSVAASTITNFGTVRIDRTDDFTFANIVAGPGAFQKYNTNTVTISTAQTYTGPTTITDGGLRISNAGALGTTDGTTEIQNSATAVLELTGGITLLEPLRVASKPGAAIGDVPHVNNISGNNTLASPMMLAQNGSLGWIFKATAGYLLIPVSNTPLDASQTSQTTTRPLWLRGDATGEWSGSIRDNIAPNAKISVRKDGPGTWILSGANTYTGPTVVSNGTLLVNGSLAASSAVTVEGGILGGSGVIGGPVTVNAAGTFAPGTSAGTLTINNSLILNGTTIMEVSDYGSDKVAGIGSLTLGGTLQVVVSGTLRGWEVFKLFSATSYSGDFAYALPDISPLSWDTTSVPVDGTLKVIGGSAPPPTIEPLTVSGTNLVVSVLTAPVGHYVLQSTTNLTPTVVWRNESTNDGTGGTLTLSVPIDPNKPQKFVRFWVY